MMSRSYALRGLLLASATAFPLAAWGQATQSPANQSATADAIRVLLDQANYWRSQYQPQKADEALARVLTLDPRNADALAAQAQAAADRGNQQAARAALAKLQSVRPDDPRIGSIQQALQMGPLDQSALTEARRLAQAGKAAEAIAAYRRVFRGDTPPANLATEYYQTLAATEGNWQSAREGLAAQLRTNPQDLRAQLAYAELLTYRDETRDEGIARLKRLTQSPSIADQADKDLRQTLLWLPVNQTSIPQYDLYLSRHPDDTEIQKREQMAKADVGGLRLSGFDALQNGKIADAEAGFTKALVTNPNDSDSMIGLALVRFRQNRAAEARELVRRAIEIDPDKAAQDQSLLTAGQGTTSNGSNVDYGAIAARKIRGEYANVAALTRRGEYARAEAELRRLMGKRPNAGNYLQLGDIQTRAGQLLEAEASYRTVLRSQPKNVLALGGLAGVLTREGKTDEANQVFAQAEATGRAGAIGQVRAQMLRDQAQSMPDPVARAGLLRSAVAADPSNPWLRLEFARALLSQDREAEARQVMEEVTSAPRPSVDQLRAGIYFADAVHDNPLAASLVSRLPPSAMTPEMRDVQVRADVANDLRDARSQGAAGGIAAERERMLALVAKPDPTGARATAFAAELVKAGDKAGAREVIRTALNDSRPPLPQQRIAYAGALVGAGYPQDAQIVTAGLQPDRLNPLQRSTLTEVNNNAAVFSADQLNGQGHTADAYDALAPHLAAQPDDPALNLALARLYATKDQPKKALQVDEELLKRNPSSLDVRVGTISAAIAAGDLGRASDLANQTKQEFPDEPQAWVAAAQVARARGDNGQALAALKNARTLRAKQLDSSSSSDASDVQMPRQPVRYAAYVPANTTSDTPGDLLPLVSLPPPASVPGAVPGEPVTREYQRYAQYLPPNPVAASLQGQTNQPSYGSDAPLGMVSVPTGDPTGDLSAPPSLGARAPQPPAPIQTSQVSPATDTPAYNNPFRPNPAPTLDEPSASAPGILGGGAQRVRPTDPLIVDIDRSIQQVSAEVAPSVEGSLSLRGRSGNPGIEQLFELSAPLEASFSPNGYGRLKVSVTPVYLYSGTASTANLQNFGTNPLVPTGSPLYRAGQQTAAGAALDVGYAYDIVSADIGSTPLGFNQTNIVGGIEIAPKLSTNLTLRVLGERRAVTDSLLSYAGARDPRTGESFGGVTRNRGHIQLEGAFGKVYYYAGAGAGVLVGDRVRSNTEVDAGAGLSFPVWSTPTQEVRVGTDLVYFDFARNLETFTVGGGGYFSPQNFFALLFPVTYKEQLTPDLVYSVGGSVGFQTFRQKSTPIFPDADLQSQLVSLAATQGNTATTIGGSHTFGVAGGAHGDIDYRVNDNLHIGARAGFDKSGNFTEGTGLVYARYVFNDPK
jgi:tetratricopeptide (TPR) repeat protein